MAINKISDVTKEQIRQKSVQSLPNRPSEQGFKASDIKLAITSPMLNGNKSLVGEVNRIVDEINEKVSAIEEALEGKQDKGSSGDGCQCNVGLVTTAPSYDNIEGRLDFVSLNYNPPIKHEGYIYIIDTNA